MKSPSIFSIVAAALLFIQQTSLGQNSTSQNSSAQPTTRQQSPFANSANTPMPNVSPNGPFAQQPFQPSYQNQPFAAQQFQPTTPNAGTPQGQTLPVWQKSPQWQDPGAGQPQGAMGSTYASPSETWDQATGSPPILSDDPSCPSFCRHRATLFGDFLFLTAREVDLAYATHVDGPILNAVPLAPPAVVAPDYSAGFRVGGSIALDSLSSITATYWNYSNSSSDSLTLPGGTGWLRPELTHPDTPAADIDKLSAAADYGIDFRMADVAYKALLCQGDTYSVNYVVGLRYAHLEQDLLATYSILGVRTVQTEIKFDGLGGRVGLAGEQLFFRGFLIYGQVFGNLLAGKFTADYVQQYNLAGTEAVTGLDDNRFVPQLELEAGVGWQCFSGRLRLRAGYYFGSWFNIATTPTWIDAVQTNNTTDINEILIFDGLTARAELRF